MLVSRKWLEEYLNIKDFSDQELYDIFTAHVCEVETMERLVSATNLTVGYVKECVDIEGTHLHQCQVEVRPNEVLQIVCGAPNVASGKKVIVANVGAVLPGNFKIKASKIRGYESNGMLCSLEELGIPEKYVPEAYKNGIYLFEDDLADVQVGEDPLEILGLNDTIYDLAVTSNRSDLLSIEGVAYDLGAALGQKVIEVTGDIEESNEKNPINVEVKTDKCLAYNVRYIKNVKIKKSPIWLRSRLIASGIRPINNVVDVTNLVLMELGQPLHSFDADKLGNNIVVRCANDGEVITTLDDIERKLTKDDILITDGVNPLCVAGVMGGASTEVTDETVNIALEAAYFDPLTIRKTSSRLNLSSESSVRFERKIDFDRTQRALDYAASLIADLADGEVSSGVVSQITKELEPKSVDITTAKINSVLGTNFNDSEVEKFFNNLAYDYEKLNGVYHINIPSRRMDLEESPQDIIEDVARMYGYDNIPTTLAKTRDKGGLTYKQKRTRLIRQILAYSGLNEIISYSLIKEEDLGLYVKDVKNPVKVLMPLTEDKAVMRQSLLNGMIEAISYNKSRKNENLNFFEIGEVYSEGEEHLHLAIGLNGIFSSRLWNGEKQVANFYLLKGLADALFARLGFTVEYETETGLKNMHPGRTAKIIHHKQEIGFIGELHPRFAQAHDVKNTVVLEIDLEAITTEENRLKYHSINKFPSVSRDLAIVVDDSILASQIEESIKKAARSALTSIKLFDVYKGENVAKNEKSLAFSLTFEDPTKTYSTEEVDALVENIMAKLKKDFNARLR